MKATRWLVIGLLVLAAFGCARSDWIATTLVTVDVTGVWAGGYTLRPGGSSRGTPGSVQLTLEQNGPKVTGRVDLLATTFPGGQKYDGHIEGRVSGDRLTFQRTSGGLDGDFQVNGDEMAGFVRFELGTASSITRRRQQ